MTYARLQLEPGTFHIQTTMPLGGQNRSRFKGDSLCGLTRWSCESSWNINSRKHLVEGNWNIQLYLYWV